jgi:hypothetical protein
VFQREGSVEFQEEDQGQADEGKPSKLVASLILVLLMHDLLLFMKMHGFIYCYVVTSPFKDDDPYAFQC